MKKLVIVLFFALVLVSCSNKEQKAITFDSDYTLNLSPDISCESPNRTLLLKRINRGIQLLRGIVEKVTSIKLWAGQLMKKTMSGTTLKKVGFLNLH